MAYWITVKKADVRHGMSAATLEAALAVLEAKEADGYQVRVIHPDGYELTAAMLRILVDATKVELEAT